MKNAMISVRMPSTLVQELRDIAEKNHYLDLSEQIREILRIKCESYESYNKVSGKEEPSKQENEGKEQLIRQLQSILEQMKREL